MLIDKSIANLSDYLRLYENKAKIQKSDDNKSSDKSKDSRIGCWSWGNHIYYYEKESNLRSQALFHVQRFIYYIFSKIGLTHDANSQAFTSLKEHVISKFEATINPDSQSKFTEQINQISELTKIKLFHEEQILQLTTHRDELQEKVNTIPPRDEYEKLKIIHMEEKNNMITQLEEKNNMITQLEELKANLTAKISTNEELLKNLQNEKIEQQSASSEEIKALKEPLEQQKQAIEKGAAEFSTGKKEEKKLFVDFSKLKFKELKESHQAEIKKINDTHTEILNTSLFNLRGTQELLQQNDKEIENLKLINMNLTKEQETSQNIIKRLNTELELKFK
jgi:hypothetical protein